jgi:hypothetical protein
MLPDRSNSKMRVLPSPQFAWANARQTYKAFLAVLVLCAAIAVATPAFGATSKAHSDSATNHQGWQVAVVIPDHQRDVNATVGLTGTYKVHPLVKTLLTAIVLINPKNCAEYAPGSWTTDSAAKYGDVYKGLVTGRLVDGACHKYKYTGDGIYYKWVADFQATKDKFKATWKAADSKVPVTFDLLLEK